MAEIELTRFAFLNKGFTCPTKGCGQTVTHRHIQEAHGVALGRQVPTGYMVRCPKCRTHHVVNITDPGAPAVPGPELTRSAFLNKGFACPVDGCTATVTQRDVEPVRQNISPDPPSFYIVRCSRCWTGMTVHIKD